ncbi:hypothetical protein CAOG_04985 [Capsaspora owczarzaki ATCC 30864]|uniref:Uncharacterized protein n=1 Tax=Capsaspora owczarzaki (strain ATCC 30864) TaxID=595528 RepID=A0A0D2UGV1_CAPO3|nr:hypothetical protein CAOG_04985 [Capsaspora owczarzaki ATCC 30864]KJE94326.1 hypothetical protein CAOG_004985 [Capsaspora owczarzaki ATCC 30864]|eukprot:XP_004346670.1 hypothetical protein CAOG_04985 [Capsaspora owczarzaki ATCC 30864]
MANRATEARRRLAPLDQPTPWPTLRDWIRQRKMTSRTTWIDILREAGVCYWPWHLQYLRPNSTKTPSIVPCTSSFELYKGLDTLYKLSLQGPLPDVPHVIDDSVARQLLLRIEPILEDYAQIVESLLTDHHGGWNFLVTGSDEELVDLNAQLAKVASEVSTETCTAVQAVAYLMPTKFEFTLLRLALNMGDDTPATVMASGGLGIRSGNGLGTLGVIAEGLGITAAHVIERPPPDLPHRAYATQLWRNAPPQTRRLWKELSGFYHDPATPVCFGHCVYLDHLRDIAIVVMSDRRPIATNAVCGLDRLLWPNPSNLVKLREDLALTQSGAAPPFSLVKFGIRTGRTRGTLSCVTDELLAVEEEANGAVADCGDSGSCWTIERPLRWRGAVIGFTSQRCQSDPRCFLAPQLPRQFCLLTPVWHVLEVLENYRSTF